MNDSINRIITELLKNRGVCDEADVLEFLSDSPKLTYDPFMLKGVKEGVELIKKHLERGSRICIYGDYDADGVTSVTLMMTALSKVTDNISYYIPSRFGEGYGLNMDAVKKVAEDHTDLIITVDCGSVSYEEVEYAKSLGMDVIVTDHHSITDKKADCILINPKQPDSGYPFDGLAGVGVAFKLVQALNRAGVLEKSVISEVLDLVAVGTIGDIVPLVDENRTLVKFGLRQVNSGRRAGLAALIRGVGLNLGHIGSDNVAFVIVPHINAAGRLEDASLGVKLLLEGAELVDKGISEGAQMDIHTNERLIEELIVCNKKRKTVQQETFENCLKQVDLDNLPSIILINAGDAHEGITGIVAGKLKEQFYRPSIIVTSLADDETMLKGTGRSVEDVNLYELLKQSDSLFTKFGGHKGACGFTIPAANLEKLASDLDQHMQELLAENPAALERKSPAEMVLNLSDVSIELAQELEKLAPFGASNPAPVFEFRGVTVERPQPMGATGIHVRFNAVVGGQRVQCVLFSKAKEYADIIYDGAVIDIAAYIEISVWNGQQRLQLILQGLQPAEVR